MESKITREFCRVLKDLEDTPEILNRAIEAILSEVTLWEVAWGLKNVDKDTFSLIERAIDPKILENIKLMAKFIGPVLLRDVEEFQNKFLYILKNKDIEGLGNIHVEESMKIPKPYSLSITVDEIKEMIENGELDY